MQRIRRVAGLRLFTSPPLEALAPFASEGPGSGPAPSRPLAPPLDELEADWQGSAEGLLAGSIVPLGLRLDSLGLTLGLPGGGAIRTLRGGEGVELLSESAPPDLHEQAMLGPGLCLALTLRGVVCLHASAAICERGLCVFLGESGAGKSTLARFLGQRPGWRRVADDCLPVVLARREGCSGLALLARPHFPQLKLDSRDQWPPEAPTEIPVARVYHLAPPKPGDPSVGRTPVTRGAASLLLVRHTAAARLFPPRLLGWHLGWACGAAESTPVSALLHPRRLEILPRVVERIEQDLRESDRLGEPPPSRLT